MKLPAYSAEIRNESFKDKVSSWLQRWGIGRSYETTATARELKFSDPNVLGWNGGESLANLAKKLGVDAVLVGHLHVAPPAKGGTSKGLEVRGPKVWVFSTDSYVPLVIAGIKPNWTLAATPASAALKAAPIDTTNADIEAARQFALKNPNIHVTYTRLRPPGHVADEAKLNWTGIDDIASALSSKMAGAFKN